jgi:cellulose synthase operon protein YhjQ
MKTVAFISGKGGVGKSTVCANLAVALAKRDKRVAVIDIDPQNSQRLHLGLGVDEIAGLVREGVALSSLFDSPFGVHFIPFGRVVDEDLETFREELLDDPDWLRDRLPNLHQASFDYIFLDTPPGASIYLEQALRASHKALSVLLPDAGSYLTLNKIDALVQHYTRDRPEFEGATRLINQMPNESRLGHQVRQAVFSDRAAVAPLVIHRDHAVAQSLAYERPVLEYQPGCMASLDFQYLADWFLDSYNG